MKGEKIKEKLISLGKTQKELALLLGITPQAIYEILSSTDGSSGSIEKIARALSVIVSFFFDEEKTSDATIEDSFILGGKVRSTYNIGKKVRLLLKEQRKTVIDLSRNVGITDIGMRKIFERDTLAISPH